MYYRSEEKPIHLTLVKDRLRVLKQGYPWIFKGELLEVPKVKPGSLAVLKDDQGTILAKGFCDPGSPLAFRILTLGKKNINDDLIALRIKEAVSLRRLLFDQDTTGFRLINGEGDGLPGLVCDIYGRSAVIQFDGNGPSGFYEANAVAALIAESLQLENVYKKPRHNDVEKGEPLFGAQPTTPVHFLENKIKFAADITKGQKTGFFLDQRDNRQRIARLAKGKSMLNLFGYTGGFSVYAGINGAREVTTVDLAKPAIDAAINNWELNQLDRAIHHAVAQDVFVFLNNSKEEKTVWDIVIVDPPSFAHSRESVEVAGQSYHKLITAALFAVNSGGILAASSCSSKIDPELFLNLCQKAFSTARRKGNILGVYGQPADHPYPLACPDLRYLKFVIARVD